MMNALSTLAKAVCNMSTTAEPAEHRADLRHFSDRRTRGWCDKVEFDRSTLRTEHHPDDFWNGLARYRLPIDLHHALKPQYTLSVCALESSPNRPNVTDLDVYRGSAAYREKAIPNVHLPGHHRRTSRYKMRNE